MSWLFQTRLHHCDICTRSSSVLFSTHKSLGQIRLFRISVWKCWWYDSWTSKRLLNKGQKLDEECSRRFLSWTRWWFGHFQAASIEEYFWAMSSGLFFWLRAWANKSAVQTQISSATVSVQDTFETSQEVWMLWLAGRQHDVALIPCVSCHASSMGC